MKIETAIQIASLDLKRKNIETPFLDSEILMSKVLKKDRKFIFLNSNKELNDIQYQKFKKLISSRLRRKPIAYITGKKFFWKYEFEVNDKVLIPRPDTELIIEQLLETYKHKNRINLLEIGVGSGCIILSILKEKKNFIGKGLDLSKDCIELCKINADKLRVNHRIKFYKSDIDNFNLGKYDLIISNPPYIKKLDFNYLSGDVIKSEPRLALDGGIDGLSEIRKFIKKSSELIKNRGKLFLEIAHDQKNEVKKILIENGFYINKTVKDLAKNDRCVISTKI